MKQVTRIIPKDSVSEATAWKAPVVGGDSLKEGDVPLVTAKAIEQLQKSAYKEGFAEGKQQGLKEGHAEGLPQGREEGYQQGHQEGIEAGGVEVKTQVEQLQGIVDAMQSPLNEIDEVVADEIVTLAIALAQQIIRREIHTDPGQVIGVARDALKILPVSADKPKIWLHPEDIALINQQLSSEEVASYQLMEDGALSRGGCRVENSLARIDATVEKQINSVVAELFGGERGGEIDVATPEED